MNTFIEDNSVFAGINTFHNLPYMADLKDMDYAILGVPFDTAAADRCGSRFAPLYIRADGSFRTGFGFHTSLDVYGDAVKGTDMGEIFTYNGYTTPTLPLIESAVAKIIETNTISILLGGGQICTLPELRALKKVYGPMAMIHFSADRSVSDEEDYMDDNVLIHAIKEELIIPEKTIQLGIRGGYDSKEQADYAKDLGLTVISAAKLHDMPLEETIAFIKEKTGDSPCLISLDMGFMDPAYAPGVAVPKPGGFSTYEIRTILLSLVSSLNMKAFDLVNLVPMYDAGQITTQAADGILYDVVCALAKRKTNGGI